MSAIVEFYKDLMTNKIDQRTTDFALTWSPGTLLMVIASYVYFCVYAGPRYMRDKKPYDLRTVMIVYNMCQVLASCYIVYEGMYSGWATSYNYACQPVDYSDAPEAKRMINAVYFFYVCKLSEFLETIFFVMRKKTRQVSALHLYHHSMMLLCGWVGLRFLPNGHGTFLGVINGGVHAIMYTYYLLSSMGPHMQKYLWWKKYLTTIQLIQFVIVFFHAGQIFFNGCNYPKFIAFLLCLNSVVFMYMFGSFYVENYLKRKENNKIAAEAKKAAKNKPE